MSWWSIARSQGGVISSAQLEQCGISRYATSRMRHSGELLRLSQGTYLSGGAPLTFSARLWAAHLATGGVLAFETAGQLWGVFDGPDEMIHVVLPHQRRVATPSGVRLHRCLVPASSVQQRSALPTCSRTWTVLDLISTLPFGQASRLADRALQRRWITRQDVESRLRDYVNRSGNGQLRKLSTQLADGAAAYSERLLHRLLSNAGISGWVPNFEVWSSGELMAVVDVAFPERAIAIEVDGMAHHVDVDRFRRDRGRQNALVAMGWTVLRFTWADLTERPGYVIAMIRRVAA